MMSWNVSNAEGSNNSDVCPYNMSSWDTTMDQLYTYIYLLIFIPGLMGNGLALWVLCRFIRKKTKAIIFMINLAIADLLHVLSLPLRIHYYLTHTWPFGKELCLLCFYLKYLNMYASIAFLVCISIQRCSFLMRPFCAKKWKRRYDMRISAAVWLVVGLCCSPFILMRSNGKGGSGCFKDLPTRKLSLKLLLMLHCPSLSRGYSAQQPAGDKRKALQLVLVCTGVFLFCFAPYHVNFLLYMLVSQDVIMHCPIRLAVLQFHPISLCIASLNCCLNPLIYYFLTTEFREQLSRHGSSVLRGRLMSMESSSSYRE
ncbi:hypothetical protein GJAV_G00198380 [Gymnothorax javanicus]|nr:hypothetical protein GJAV_G00198380 [Gymnothorax javanicus]